MPTIIDSLVVELGLNTAKYEAGTDKAQASLREFQNSTAKAGVNLRQHLGRSGEDFTTLQKTAASSNAGISLNLRNTANQATRTAKELEARGGQAASFFGQIKTQALGLFAVLLGGKGLEATVMGTSQSLRDLGQSAANIGVSVRDLSAFTMAIERNGGSADAAKTSLQGLAGALQEYNLHANDKPLAQGLAIIKASSKETPLQIARDLARYADTGVSRQRLNEVAGMLHLNQDIANEAARGSKQFDVDMADSRAIGVPSDADVKKAADFQRQLLTTEQEFATLGRTIASDIEPPLTAFLKDVDGFIEKNPALAGEIAKTTGVVVGLAAGLTAIGNALKLIRGAQDGLGWLLGSGAKGAASGGTRALAGGAATGEEAAAIGGAEALAGGAGAAVATAVIAAVGIGALAALGAAEALKLAGVKPTGDAGTWADRTIPGAAAADDAAGRYLPAAFGGRTYAQQAAIDPTNPVALAKQAKERSRQAIDFFMSKAGGGYTLEQAAGLAGNIQRESGFNAALPGDSGNAYGIGQWHRDRQDLIAAHFGKTVQQMSYGEQLQAMAWELQNNEAAAGRRLRQQTSAAGAGATVSQYYERPRFVQQEATLRAMNAVDRLNEYKRHRANIKPGAMTSPAGISQQDVAAAMRGAIPGGTDYSGALAAVAANQNTHNLLARRGASTTIHNTDASSTSETNISGPITVTTQGRDAAAIARDMRRALSAKATAALANGGAA